jgi:hypothetical protein
MAPRRTLTLTETRRHELEHHRDHDRRPWVRERCAALLKIARTSPTASGVWNTSSKAECTADSPCRGARSWRSAWPMFQVRRRARRWP